MKKGDSDHRGDRGGTPFRERGVPKTALAPFLHLFPKPHCFGEGAGKPAFSARGMLRFFYTSYPDGNGCAKSEEKRSRGNPFWGKGCFLALHPENLIVLERGTLRLPSNCFFLVQNSSPVNRNVPLSKRIYKVELSELPDCSMNPSANRVKNPLSPNASPLGEVACEARRRGCP